MTDEHDTNHFRASLTSSGPISVVIVRGELDLSVVSELAAIAYRVASTAEGGLIVDLDEVTFLSSSAITALVKTSEHLPPGASMALVAVRSIVVRPLELSGIDRIIPTFPDRESAITHLDSGDSTR